MSLFYQPFIGGGAHHLDPEESRHCARVMRKKSGDSITITDGKGKFYEVLLTDVDPKQCSFRIIKETTQRTRDFYIHIAVSPTKNADRIEWFVEKSIELGIDEISFIRCERSERPALKLERIERVAVSAMKQSVRATLPKINGPVDYRNFVAKQPSAQKFIAQIDATNPHHLKDLAKAHTSYCVLIGPEGDFTANEIAMATDKMFSKVSLGVYRLRTETAALAACHTLNLLNL